MTGTGAGDLREENIPKDEVLRGIPPMNLQVLRPEALWLCLPLLLVILWHRSSWNMLRLIIALALILALMELQWTRERGQPRVMVVLDVSSSCKDRVLQTWKETQPILEKSRPHDGLLNVMAFAGEAGVWPTADRSDLRPNQTRLRQGLMLASAAIPEGERAKILLLSDGQSTEALLGLTPYLLQRGHNLYWQTIRSERENDAAVTSLSLPEQSAPHEAFLVDIEVVGPGANLTVQLNRGQQSLGQHKIPLVRGQGRLRLKDHIDQPGHYRYAVSIVGHNDAQRGNDTMSRDIRIEGQGGILLISPYLPDPLAENWRRSGFKVIQESDPSRLEVGRLSGAQAVVLHNTPADQIPLDFLKALTPYVEQQGGGLAMVGGPHSFGSGGYYQSPIDPLLPVSLEIKDERFKLSLALGIVLDRSGSMGVTVGGGKTKMQLANEGSATAVDLLGYSDAVTVFAVDSLAHVVVPLSKVGHDKTGLAHRIRSIQSMGGGIFVYEGLQACFQQLRSAPQANKHIILFSDATDSEEPGDYKKLLADMALEKITVSVIGLGRASDPDAALLRDIATRGSGRMFFCENAKDVPSIFAQETMSVARSAYIEETRLLAPCNDLMVLGHQVPTPDMVQAYNLCLSRPQAHTALATADGDQDPLLAFWQRGAGRVLCFTSPLAGISAHNILAWSPYADFCNTWGRWILKGDLPVGLGLEQRRLGDSQQFDLYYDSTWNERFAAAPPQFTLVELHNPERLQRVVWEQTKPGHFQATVPLSFERELLGAVSMGNVQIPVGPLSLGSSAEWLPQPEMASELREISRQSGGGPLSSLDQLWNQEKLISRQSLLPWLVGSIGLLVLLEMLGYKLAWNLGWFGPSSRTLRQSKTGPSDLPKLGSVEEAPTPAAEADPFKDRLRRLGK